MAVKKLYVTIRLPICTEHINGASYSDNIFMDGKTIYKIFGCFTCAMAKFRKLIKGKASNGK